MQGCWRKRTDMAVEDAWFMEDKDTGKKVPTKRHGRGKRWRVRNRGARTVSFHKKSDAEAHDTNVKSDLMHGVTPFDHTAGRVLFKLYAEKLVAERYRNPNSLRTMKSRLKVHLIPFFGEKRICDIRPSTVTSFRLDLAKKGLSPTMVRHVDTLLGMIIHSAVADKLLGEDPYAGSKTALPAPVKRPVTIWEQATVNAILDGLPDREHPIGLLSATCGHRQGESFAVAVDDINFLRNKITVSHQVQYVDGGLALVPPKGNKVRTVPLPEVTSLALAESIRQYGTITVRCRCCNVAHRILFSRNGKLMSNNIWAELWPPVVEAAGLTPSRHTGQHMLRHYFASLLIDGNASMKEVCEYMGHANIKITADVYGHLFERSHEKTRKIVDQAFSGRVYQVRTAQDQ
jgi:integrase